MNSREDILVSLALKGGYITRNQIQRCQQIKAAHFPNKSLGQILIEQKFLTPQDIQQLQQQLQVLQSAAQSGTKTAVSGPVPPCRVAPKPPVQAPPLNQSQGDGLAPSFELEKRKDQNFGILCIRMAFASKEDVQACIQEQNQLQRGGLFVRLGELMMEKGILTIQQVEKILDYQKKKILNCGGCGAQYNISNYKAGKKVRCRKCGAILVVPQSLDSPQAHGSIYMEESETSIPTSPLAGNPLQESPTGTGDLAENPTEIQLGFGLPPSPPVALPGPSKAVGPSASTHITHFGGSEEDNFPTSLGGANLGGPNLLDQIPEEKNLLEDSDPLQTTTQAEDRRAGDRRKKDRRGMDRRKGDRRKGDRRGSSLSPEEEESLQSKKKMQMMLMITLGLGGLLILLLFAAILFKPQKKVQIREAMEKFERNYSQARLDRDEGFYERAEKSFRLAIEASEDYVSSGGEVSAKFEKDKKECEDQYNRFKTFIEAVKGKKLEQLAALLEKLGPNESLFQVEIAKKLAQSGDERALGVLQKKLSFRGDNFEEDVLEVLKHYQGTVHETRAIRILSSALMEALRMVEKERKRGIVLSKGIPKLILTIASFSNQEAVHALKKVVEYSETGTYILKAIQGLVQIGGKEIVPVLVIALTNQAEDIRQEAQKGLIRSGVFSIPYLERLVKRSEAHTPPVEALQIIGELAKVYPDRAFKSYKKILEEALSKNRWDICFYSLSKLIELPQVSETLKSTMMRVMEKICENSPKRIDKTYYTKFFAVARYLNMQKEQLKVLGWMEKLQKLRNFKWKEIPSPSMVGKVPGSEAVVEVSNQSRVKVILLFKADDFQQVLEIPPQDKRTINLPRGTLYDILGISYDTSLPPYFGKEVFDTGCLYSLTLAP